MWYYRLIACFKGVCMSDFKVWGNSDWVDCLNEGVEKGVISKQWASSLLSKLSSKKESKLDSASSKLLWFGIRKWIELKSGFCFDKNLLNLAQALPLPNNNICVLWHLFEFLGRKGALNYDKAFNLLLHSSITEVQASMLSLLLEYSHPHNDVVEEDIFYAILKSPYLSEEHYDLFRFIVKRAREGNLMYETLPLKDLISTERITPLQVQVCKTIYRHARAGNEVEEDIAICLILKKNDISPYHAYIIEYVCAKGGPKNNITEMKAIINVLKAKRITPIQLEILTNVMDQTYFNHDLDSDWVFARVLESPHISRSHAYLINLLIEKGRVFNGLNENSAFFYLLKTKHITEYKVKLLSLIIEKAQYGFLDENLAFKEVLRQDIGFYKFTILRDIILRQKLYKPEEVTEIFLRYCKAEDIDSSWWTYWREIAKQGGNNMGQKLRPSSPTPRGGNITTQTSTTVGGRGGGTSSSNTTGVTQASFNTSDVTTISDEATTGSSGGDVTSIVGAISAASASASASGASGASASGK